MEKEIFDIYALCVALLIGKTLFMSPLTTLKRMATGVFASPEDVKAKFIKDSKVGLHPDVERIRNAHRNDLENVLTFCILAPVYLVAVQPSIFMTKLVLYGFTAARFVHSVVYLMEVN